MIRALTVLTILQHLLLLPAQASVPSSGRSREAIARVGPELDKALDPSRLKRGSPIFVRVFKQERELELWVKRDSRFVHFRTYSICAFSGSLGPKLRKGDGQAPEGFYFVTPSRMNPSSSYHLAFNLGYPNAYDRAHRRTGDFLMIHGNCVSIGCYAMTDKGIEEIYAMADAALRGGQSFFRVHLFPFRMSRKNMEHRATGKWLEFWTTLKRGYDWFEENRVPPDVQVWNANYVFRHAP